MLLEANTTRKYLRSFDVKLRAWLCVNVGVAATTDDRQFRYSTVQYVRCFAKIASHADFFSLAFGDS
jgi:hypothetical protein